MARGQELIDQCKKHVLEAMRAFPECRPQTGTGLGNRAIEDAAGFALELGGQDGWFTWSLLASLVQDGKIEVVPGTERRRRFRLR